MNRMSRQSSPPLEVQVLREGIVESTHKAHIAACDERGRILASAGDPEFGTFIRSSLKPFQALSITTTGALDQFNLTDKDLAIICSSHKGNLEQVRQAFNILWRCDVEPLALQCPIPEGKDTPLAHCCSGKHAGMLAVCKQRGWSLDSYTQRSHPVQKLIISKVAELLGMPAEELICAHDSCGAPTYLMQLSQIATLFAKLASGDNLDLERIVRAMTSYPEMISGAEGFDSQLMSLSEGAVVSKSGSEGVQCVGRVGDGMAIAIKITDGSKRAKYATAVYLLKQLGWITPDVSEALAEKFMMPSKYTRIDVVGDMPLM
ncbi:MAG: asparaginase [Cyanobacteria bacterium P01_F01_bin.53]